MFGFGKARLPVSDEWQAWIDAGFVRLGELLGASRALNATVSLPTPECFPDAWDESRTALDLMFERVARVMGVDPSSVDLSVFGMHTDATQGLVPEFSGRSSGAGGYYLHTPTGPARISVNETKLKDPVALVAVLAHELGHVILLRPGKVARDEEDMEPLNDLLTVFLGFGVFNANAAFQFEQHQDSQTQGWSTQRLGYLTEQAFGYALARFAYERREDKPAWARHLKRNPASYFDRSLRWLREEKMPRLLGG